MDSTLIFTIIPFNSIHFHQIGKFSIIFDTRLCEINDLVVSSHQMAPLLGNYGNFLSKLVNFDLVNSDLSLNFLKFTQFNRILSDPK